MSTVLAYTSPAIGHLFPMVPLLQELRRRGDDVHVRTLGSHLERVRSLGLQAEAIDPGVEAIPHHDFKTGSPRAALAASAAVFATRARDGVVRRLVLGAVVKAMLPDLNALRREFGLASVASADEFLRKAPLTLVTSAKPFEYDATDWGPDVLMVGASPWEPRRRPQLGSTRSTGRSSW